EELTITITNSYGEKTYDTIENAPVYIDEKYRRLEDLNEGDKVELVLNPTGDVVFIQVLETDAEPITVSARGLVTDVDEDDGTVSLFTYVNDDKGFVGILKTSDVEGWHYELSTGYGTFVLTGDTDGLEDYVGKTIVVAGALKTGASIYMKGYLIDVEEFYPVKATDVVTFKVDDNTKITIDGKTAELSDIETGDLAEVKAQGETALQLKVSSVRARIREQERETEEIKEKWGMAMKTFGEVTSRLTEKAERLEKENIELKAKLDEKIKADKEGLQKKIEESVNVVSMEHIVGLYETIAILESQLKAAHKVSLSAIKMLTKKNSVILRNHRKNVVSAATVADVGVQEQSDQSQVH
ncbi:MAG: hypothetical protein K6U74_09890, partial [Firmicutes bacterium]|nr:hypothetical protein [Bacillota bacterium]